MGILSLEISHTGVKDSPSWNASSFSAGILYRWVSVADSGLDNRVWWRGKTCVVLNMIAARIQRERNLAEWTIQWKSKAKPSPGD